MLHVLLIFLKIIGIILALIFCLIFLVLVVPVRYSFQIEKKEAETFQGRVRVTWFFALLYVKVSYIESVFDYRVRIAGYQLLGNQESFLKRKEEKQKRKRDKKKEKEKKNQQKEQNKLNKQYRKPETDEIEKKVDTQKNESVISTQPEKKVFKQKPISDKFSSKAEEKKQNPFVKAKTMISSVGKGFSSLNDKVSSVKDLYAEYHGGELLRLAKKSIIKIARHVLPRRLKGSIRFGFDDPSVTGILTGAAAILYPKYQKHFQLEPDFQESCFEADCEGRGRIHPGFFLILVIQLLINPDVRKCIKSVLN